MRRLWVVLLTLAMVTAAAAPATGAKGGIPGPPDDQGPPDDEPPVSVTCVSPWWDGDFETEDFDIVLTRDQPDACVDVLTNTPGVWVVTVTRGLDTIWRRPELMMVPRDAAWPSDSCGGIKRWGESVIDQPWVFPPADDARGFTTIPAATVNACPGNAALPGGNGIGELGELVERAENVTDYTDYEQVAASNGPVGETVELLVPSNEVHPLAFVVWSHNLRKGESIIIHVDLP